MKRLLTIPIALICAIALTQAQTATAPAKTDDVKSVDAIVSALYDVISGAPGAKHDWDRLRSLFAPESKMTAIGRRGENAISQTFSVDEYVKLAGPIIEQKGFVEKGIARHVDQFGNMAHVYTTYESRILATDKPFARGINSIELFNDGKRWWIVDIRWQEEGKGLSLPGKYLHDG
jgi:hypothetical protein